MNKSKNLLIFLTLLLAGCDATSSSLLSMSESLASSSFSSNSESSLGSSQSSQFEDLVPDDFIDKLNGKYYSKSGVLTVSDDGVSYNDISFSMSRRVVESFRENFINVDHTVVYLNDGADEYRIYLGGNGKYTLQLEKKEAEAFVLVDSFMPSINEFTGAYSAYGDGNQYNTIIHLGDNFNYYYGSFDVGYYGMFAGFQLDSFYAKSSYIYFNNELTKIVSMYDYVDNYEYYSFILKEVNGTMGLINPDYYSGGEYDYYDFYYDPLCLSYNYFSNEKSIAYPMLDVDNKKVTIDEVEYSYNVSFDQEKGQVFTLTSGSKEAKLYPNQYGLNWLENNQTTQYVYDSVDLLFGSYSYQNIDFEFKYDDETFLPTVFMNSNKVDHTYEIYNNTKAVKVSYDEKTYYFTPFKRDIALLVGSEKGDVFFVNKGKFTDVYAKTFINKVENGYKELVISHDFDVIYDGKIVEASLVYQPTIAYPYLEFAINEKDYKFTLLQENIGAAVLSSDKDEYFFDQEVIATYYGEYTFHHEIDLVLSEYKLNYYGEDLNYTIEPYYYADSFTYLLSVKFNAENQEITAFLSNEMMAMDVKDENNKVITKTCIKHSYFRELIGEYYFDGTYGPEKFKLTEDGHFYADTVNETNDGLVLDVEYDYSLQMTMDVVSSNPLPSLIFKVNDTLGIQLIKVGHTLVVGSTVYTAKYLFDFNGVYVDATNTTIIEVREDSLYVNGEEKAITSLSYDEYGTYISIDSYGSDITYSFMKYGEEYYVSSDENFYTEYTKVDFDFDTLIGEYTFETTTYTLSKGLIPFTNVEYGYSLTDGFMTTSDYSVVLKDGHVALMFKLLSDTIYFYNNGEVNVIDVVKPSLPPVPPPPPPPPLI